MASSSIAKFPGVDVASQVLESGFADDAWGLDLLIGRFAELSGGATTAGLTTTAGLVLEAQRRGEAAAWITGRASTFYPPDVAACGVDLAALPVVRALNAPVAVQAADTLLRSGGFVLVVVDLGPGATLSLAGQTRLSGLAHAHHSALLCITCKPSGSASLGSLVSLRAECEKERSDFNRFACELRVLKDKRRGPGLRYREVCHGPDGLC